MAIARRGGRPARDRLRRRAAREPPRARREVLALCAISTSRARRCYRTHDRDLAASPCRGGGNPLRDGRGGLDYRATAAAICSRRRRGPAHAAPAPPSVGARIASQSRAWSRARAVGAQRAGFCRSMAWGPPAHAAPGQTLGGATRRCPRARRNPEAPGRRCIASTRCARWRHGPSHTVSIPTRPAASRSNAAAPACFRPSAVRGPRRFLNAATIARAPSSSRGRAQQLGIERPGSLVYIGGRWWTVWGSFPRRARARARPRGADGLTRGGRELGADRFEHGYLAPTPRSRRRADLLPSSANPEHPRRRLSRPSARSAARAEADDALTGLFSASRRGAALAGSARQQMVIS